jgi:hypothetical protein
MGQDLGMAGQVGTDGVDLPRQRRQLSAQGLVRTGAPEFDTK